MNKEGKTEQNEGLISAERKMVLRQMIFYSPHKKNEMFLMLPLKSAFQRKTRTRRDRFSFFRAVFVYKV